MATLKVPHPVPTPVEDAEAIRKAVQGWGTDEKALINILAHRDAAQRKEIMLVYEKLYNENLFKRLESELSGNLERAVYRWMFDSDERQAILANLAAKKVLSDYRVIIEIACINSPDELLAVKRAYQERYKQSIEENVASHIAGDFRKLLVALVGTYRYDGEEINLSLAHSEAKILHDAIKDKDFNHVEIIRILSTRSKAQLRATFNRYKDEYGACITKDLRNELPSEFVHALMITIRCLAYPVKYFEKVLRKAISQGGIDEDALTRVIVTRAEKDLNVIKESFKQRMDITLEHALEKEVSGHYKNFLLALVGN